MRICTIGVALCLAGSALAQFDAPVSTGIRERLIGTFSSVQGGPSPEAGDEIGVFFQGAIIGRYRFTTGGDEEFSITVFGDDPLTSQVEGPQIGEIVTFQFFDLSTNTVRSDVVAKNEAGETSNIAFAGQMVLDFPGLPIPDLTPTRFVDLVLGIDPESPAAPAESGASLDADGDGAITRNDALFVLRIVAGHRKLPASKIRQVSSDQTGDPAQQRVQSISESDIRRADVNGDGIVNSADVIAILREL